MTTVFCSSSAADHYDAPTLTDLLVRLLVLVALACQPDAHAEGGVAHALRPQALVKLGVEAHVLAFIVCSANLRSSRTARGARFLKVMPCNRLLRLTVYSRVTRSVAAFF